ncbi:MAG: type I-E CRISPR-associated protein Cas6/Cse3/CasE [Thiohalocapsa sp.]|nr:type I-E CRISPR-associated protein Cas6/Cse3/CasE [Thiohalocapsa sp.]
MWYLSKVELAREQPPAILANAIFQNAYAEHQAIWRLMASNAEQPRDFLFRREQLGHWPVFYLLSPREPSTLDGAWTVQTKPFAPKLAEGQRLSFVLRANPVRTRKASDDPDDKRRYRDDVIMHAKRQEQAAEANPTKRSSQSQLVQNAGPRWLEERAATNGFALETLQVDNYCQHRLVKRGQRQAIQFSTLDYQGVLRVVDVERFVSSLHNGLGHAKGFGCGLMLIKRAG